MLRLVSFVALISAFSFAQEEVPPPESPVTKVIELEWEPSELAVSYEVKLTPDKGGKALVFKVKEAKFAQEVPTGNYKLQIRGQDKDGDMSPWSAPTPIEVAIKEIIPLSPADKAEINAEKSGKVAILFKWTPVENIRIYTLKVWSEDRKENPWVFTGRATEKKLEVPPGKTYFWQVSFESATDVAYAQEPKTYSFVLQGTALLMPEIAPYEQGKDLKWTGSDETEAYKTKLYYHHLDETEWKMVKAFDTKDDHIPFANMKPGAYKIEVIATAERRLNSAPGLLEFFVKPRATDLAKATP